MNFFFNLWAWVSLYVNGNFPSSRVFSKMKWDKVHITTTQCMPHNKQVVIILWIPINSLDRRTRGGVTWLKSIISLRYSRPHLPSCWLHLSTLWACYSCTMIVGESSCLETPRKLLCVPLAQAGNCTVWGMWTMALIHGQYCDFWIIQLKK